MQVSVLILSILLQGGAPAAADLNTFSLCTSEGAETTGKVRFVSDPFETGLDDLDARAFQEYVEQAYLHRRDSDNATTCTTYHSYREADQALGRASRPVAGTRIVTTKWRARFE